MDLKDLITRQNLSSLAGSRSFSRGEKYFEIGLVGPINEKNGMVSAKIHGSRIYETSLKVVRPRQGEARLDYSCSCPVGHDGDFCKHCVALGLAWIDKMKTSAAKSSTPASARSREISMKDIRKWLEAQDQKLILDMLLSQVKNDGRLREDLTLKIVKENAGGIDLAAYRTAIRSAFYTGGYIHYGDIHDYADGVNEAIDSIERLAKEGFQQEAMLLCEYAFEQAASAVGSVDDSDGNFSEFCERLGALHLTACKTAKPDPLELAGRLFAFEMIDSDLDIFHYAAQNYKSILGKPGLAEYRRCAEQEWSKVKKKEPGSRDTEFAGKRWRITSIMESLAKAAGDVDSLIEIKARDLAHSYSFLKIAEICKEADRRDEGFGWAERGLSSFPEDNDLRDFVAKEYHRLKRYDEAFNLYRVQYAERAELDQYKKLMEYSKKIGRYESAREEALAYLRKEIEAEKKNPKSRYWHYKPDHSRLVEIFLWEKNGDAAWAEAKSGGCNDRLWRELAQRRENEHPADSAEVYKRLVEPIIERKTNDAYAEASRMISKIRDLMGHLGEVDEFASYLTNLRIRHKPKRNLMKLMEKVK